ncbi:MAG: hypothetical protein PHQ11_13775 [Paludibacter sp.]|nr:hypothetical protein [Paludibacter sp.]MDD4429142.1 hypothetical protein [Paludibacter sp.]
MAAIFGGAIMIILLGAGLYIVPIVNQNWHRYHSARDVIEHIDWCFEDYTVYAPCCTEEKFNEVKTGMTQGQILLLIGEPLKKLDNLWFYTQLGKSDRNYFSRIVEFDCNDKVIRISKFYNVD